LLQKEEIENRKKILELEHALKENEEIKSRSNAAQGHSCLEGRWGSGGFVVCTKHIHIITEIETRRIINVE
jgi:hypothetical protein